MSHDEKVGYRRPPRSHCFPKGKSGNPKGRPRRAYGIAAVLMEALNERITVAVNGKRIKMSKLKAMVIQLTNKALGGDLRAIREIIQHLQPAPKEETEAAEPFTIVFMESDKGL
jgi:hypothetical protein